MNCRFTDLRHKEVISACDGTRIGFIDDVIVDTKCATVGLKIHKSTHIAIHTKARKLTPECAWAEKYCLHFE